MDKREVDFVVLKDRKPVSPVECKSGEKAIGSALRYFAERTPIPRFYQTHLGERHFSTGKVTVVPFIRLCEELGLLQTTSQNGSSFHHPVGAH